MIYATHNSLSYLKPQWYLRPLAWVGRCQSLTIEQQLGMGVSYFDIRVRFRKGKIISGHGLLNYNVNMLSIMEMINENHAVVRLTLEDKKASQQEIDEFVLFCITCEKAYENISFVGGYQKGTWKRLYEFEKDYSVGERYWTFSKKRWFPCPKLYACLNNKEYKRIGYDGYLMLDYIQL